MFGVSMEHRNHFIFERDILHIMASSSDFLSWDDDINLDDLLGEYTEYCIDDTDSEFESEHIKKPKPGTTGTCTYICPHCNKQLKTISGFRGHVTKQHNDSKSKASDCRAGAESLSTRDVAISLTPELFKTAFNTCVQRMAADPINKLNCGIGEVCEHISDSCEAEAYFFDVYKSIMDVTNITLSLEREKIFKHVHEFRLHRESHEVLVGIMESLCSRKAVLDFIQLFAIEIVGVILECKRIEETNATKAKVSENDQKVLYYVAGYIIKALKKRYMKVKDAEKRESRLGCVNNMLSKCDDDQALSGKYSKWTKRVDRGGLQHSNCESFLLVREMENVVRMRVDQENMNVHTLLKAPLKEAIMDSYMTKYYVDKLFSPVTASYASVCEDIAGLFLTVRGYATTRLVRNKLKMGKKSVSLRGGLKGLQKKSRK